LTIGRQKHSVITDLGFFSSPEYDGSYLNHPSPTELVKGKTSRKRWPSRTRIRARVQPSLMQSCPMPQDTPAPGEATPSAYFLMHRPL